MTDVVQEIVADGADGGPPPPPEFEAEDDVGPTMPPKKKRKLLEYEQQYLQALPMADMYEKSYMHRDTVLHVAVAPGPDFIITASADGHIKFWKKLQQGVEFAKHFKAHLGPVTGLAVSSDGSLCASISTDRTVKVFDVSTFDMIAMIKLPYLPGCLEWLFKRGDSQARLAISDAGAPPIYIYDVRSPGTDPVGEVTLHMAPVTAMRYNPLHDSVISTDAKGGAAASGMNAMHAGGSGLPAAALHFQAHWSLPFSQCWCMFAAGVIDFWSPDGYGFPQDEVSFTSKLDTDLYALAKAKVAAHSLEISPDGSRFVVVASDRKIRVFKFASGKLSRVYDESLEAANQLQRGGSGAGCKGMQ